MKKKLIFVFALIIVTSLVCKPRTNDKPDPFWDIDELSTKREKRGKTPRGRSSRSLRAKLGPFAGLSVQNTLRFLEPKVDKAQTDYIIC